MTVLVFLAIKAESGRKEEVHRLLREHAEVIESHSVDDGPFDVVAYVSVEAFEDYREFAVERMACLPHVEDYTSFITLSD